MTWVEAVPGITLLFGCITLAITSGNLHKRHRYRGFLDNRIGIHHGNDRNQVLTRMENRDKRIVIFKKETDWIHPVWRPQAEARKWYDEFLCKAE